MDFDSLALQNPWWYSRASIAGDAKIREFEAARLKWMPRLRGHLDMDKDVMYSIRGPRQVGKSTLVKLIIRDELSRREPHRIFYFACDLVSNAKELSGVLEAYFGWAGKRGGGRTLICLDEVSRVKDWESAYKQFVDVHSLSGTTFILTGSSSWDLKHGIERLGGRKGEASGEQNHKVLLPMKFAEYVKMRDGALYEPFRAAGLDGNSGRKRAFLGLMGPEAEAHASAFLPLHRELDALLDEYFLTGGILPAANQYVSSGEILNATYEVYLQLFFGDIARLGRDEDTAKKVLSCVLHNGGTPAGWESFAKWCGIPSQLTVMQYVEVLRTLFVLNVYHALDQNTRQPRHRSEKKMHLPNPFFFHAFHGYLTNPAGNYFEQAKKYADTGEGKAGLAESVCGDHLARLAYNFAPSDLYDQQNSVFYVRNANGESVDYAVRLPDGFVPVEVKYQNELNDGDYRGIRKFRRGILVTKKTADFSHAHYPAIPLSLFLMFI